MSVRAGGNRERHPHPLPQRPGRDEGLVLRGGRRRHARARTRAPGRARSEVARAPPGLPPPPPSRWCARADTSRGGGVRGARSLLAELSVARAAAGEASRFTRARARREHAASEPGPGAAKEKRASGLGARARPTQGLFLSLRHPPSAGWSVSRAGGRDACTREGRGRRASGACVGVWD